ncbi:MAG: FAD-dependent monooxygenase [Bacteroidota bacterium]
MKILIVGAGIGGLCTAVALQQKGFNVEVFEAAATLRPVGAGIALGDNAMQILDRLGLADQVKSAGAQLLQGAITDAQLRPIQIVDNAGFSLCIHRARLHEVLVGGLGKVPLHLGKRCAAFLQTDDGVQLQFEDGSQVEGDLVIGADGIHSLLRRQIAEVSLRYSGQTCWRGLTDFAMPARYTGMAVEAWGGAARFGFLVYAEGKVYWYAVNLDAEGGADNAKTLHQDLGAIFNSFDSLVNDLILSTPTDHIHRSDLCDIDPSFRKWHTDRLCLIGDAAHATTPNMGQGACQAIEDAMALALALDKYREGPKAFAKFSRVRRPKARMVVKDSWQIGQVAHWKHPVTKGLRNFLFRLTPSFIVTQRFKKLMDLNYLDKI